MRNIEAGDKRQPAVKGVDEAGLWGQATTVAADRRRVRGAGGDHEMPLST